MSIEPNNSTAQTPPAAQPPATPTPALVPVDPAPTAGVRPSSGAAASANRPGPEHSITHTQSSLAAPGDGRTPGTVLADAASARPNPLSHLAVPFQPVDYAAKGYHLEATVAPEQAVSAAESLDQEGFALDTITGVDWMAEQQMEIVYDYFHPARGLRVVVRTRVPREKPEIATISTVFPGANWHERETHDFFGIRFLGHPNLTPFLLPEDATFHPLRKDFAGCA